MSKNSTDLYISELKPEEFAHEAPPFYHTENLKIVGEPLITFDDVYHRAETWNQVTKVDNVSDRVFVEDTDPRLSEFLIKAPWLHPYNPQG
ncbi:hypothetical protein HY382_03040 [Candidatus Curtissbacteria bacterium]|nr:hypothetical protein [Candidatus Curtissbacteria bacterium]